MKLETEILQIDCPYCGRSYLLVCTIQILDQLMSKSNYIPLLKIVGLEAELNAELEGLREEIAENASTDTKKGETGT